MLRTEEKDDALISVIMGVYNQWNQKALYGAVLSILKQTYTNIEFIIYDDGSDPKVAGYLKELSKMDERIILIGKEENHGLAFSLNACIDKARGTYIARMDADDYSHPYRLEKQYQFMEEHPEYGWCGCNTMLFDEDGEWGKRAMPEIPQANDYLRFSPFVHPTVMYRAEILRECGGYLDSEETRRCEDYEIFMRLQQRGLKGYNIQKELFFYRENQESFHRRSFEHRIHEMKVRYNNFKKMHLLFPLGWIYVIRPVLGGILPVKLVAWLKRNESKENDIRERIDTTIYEGLAAGTADKGCY